MPISAKTVLVTGASRGLGLEFVRQFLKLQTPPEVLIAGCRTPETAKDLQAIAKANPTVKTVKLDVERDDDIQNAFEVTKAAVGSRGLNLLISNAGVGDTTTWGLKSQTRENLQRTFNTNVCGPVILVKTFLPLIQLAASQGKTTELSCSKAGVVLLSSLGGSLKYASHEMSEVIYNMYDYRASKAALNMVTILLATELKEHGIFVTALHPGHVRTDMGTEAADISPEESIQGSLEALGNAGAESNGKLLSYEGKIEPF